MNIDDETYKKYVEKRASKSHLASDCARAFWVGGLICCLGQGFGDIYKMLGMSEENVKALVPVTLIFLAALLTGLVLLGVGATFLASRLLSGTVLKGVPSSFTLELPPYRRPQIGKVIVRSIFDRTLFVLGRAAMVAAPAGMLIWVMANLTLDGQTLLTRSAAFLDPAARFFGLDGVILLAFILGFPANEIVVPIIIMAYLSTGSLVEMNDLSALHTLLVQNGWTWVTAVCTMLFSLMHWPCSTTCLTIRKESQSWKWTAAAFALPTAAGLASCALVANGARLVGRLLGG